MSILSAPHCRPTTESVTIPNQRRVGRPLIERDRRPQLQLGMLNVRFYIFVKKSAANNIETSKKLSNLNLTVTLAWVPATCISCPSNVHKSPPVWSLQKSPRYRYAAVVITNQRACVVMVVCPGSIYGRGARLTGWPTFLLRVLNLGERDRHRVRLVIRCWVDTALLHTSATGLLSQISWWLGCGRLKNVEATNMIVIYLDLNLAIVRQNGMVEENGNRTGRLDLMAVMNNSLDSIQNHMQQAILRWLLSSPKVRKSEIKGSSFRRFVSPKVRKSDNDIDSFLF